MKITTIRITEDQLDWIRQNHPQNLSRIVRDHIEDLMHRATPVNFHNAWREQAQKCYPYMQGGYCNICWPAGIPDKSIWQQYIRENSHGKYGSVTFDEWNTIRHNNRQTILEDWNVSDSNQISHEKSSQTRSDHAKINERGLRAFLRWIFGLQT